jgi:hypothetical protein
MLMLLSDHAAHEADQKEAPALSRPGLHIASGSVVGFLGSNAFNIVARWDEGVAYGQQHCNKRRAEEERVRLMFGLP